MSIQDEIEPLIGMPESEQLEYKAVLPPSKSIAKLIAAFANANGGVIVLGVTSNIEINGLSEDYRANEITHKAIDQISPRPQIDYGYLVHGGRRLFAIKIEKSTIPVEFEGKIYRRQGVSIILENPPIALSYATAIPQTLELQELLENNKIKATGSKLKLLEHYQSIIRIINDLGRLLSPNDSDAPAIAQEGRILARILFSSVVDNFETYLSDLLYEVYLANPSTLKSSQTVTIEEVLACSDMQEFVRFWSKQKLSKLQKGSVKGFIKDNRQIRDLNAMTEGEQNEIEKLLQIRHLYSHRNGIIDEKFLQYFDGQFTINSEHSMSITAICNGMNFLVKVIDAVDSAAVAKYLLSTQ